MFSAAQRAQNGTNISDALPAFMVLAALSIWVVDRPAKVPGRRQGPKRTDALDFFNLYGAVF